MVYDNLNLKISFCLSHPSAMEFFQSPSMLCATGWVPVGAKMAAETAGFSVAEIKSLKLNVLRSYLPNIYFQLGRQALEVILYEQQGSHRA